MRRGVGVASCWYGCGNTALPNPSTIRIGLRPDGAVVLHQGAIDIGQGSATVIAQIAADALGLPVAAFTLVGGDTALTPDAGKTSASRQTYVSGRAAEAAGRALRAAILRHANAGPDAPARARRPAASRSTVPAPSTSPRCRSTPTATSSPPRDLGPADDAARRRRPGRPLRRLRLRRPDRGARRRHPRSAPCALIRITAAHDVGRAINPTLAEGQIEGGIAQGIGMALMEEYLPGRTDNLHDYLIPTIGDVPRDRVPILIEKPDPEGPSGARGLGEHVLIPTAPAILNAIRHATGAEIDRVPALPHRVLAAIRAAEATR